MNKYQKALDNLKTPTDEWESMELQLAENNDEPIEYKEQESIDLIQELVDKATPKKPLNCGKQIYIPVCPNCKEHVLFRKKYCENCGQKLDFSELNRRFDEQYKANINTKPLIVYPYINEFCERCIYSDGDTDNLCCKNISYANCGAVKECMSYVEKNTQK